MSVFGAVQPKSDDPVFYLNSFYISKYLNKIIYI